MESEPYLSTYPGTLIVDEDTLKLLRNVLGTNEADTGVILPQARLRERVGVRFIIR